jgi:NAD-dependent deacetylase
MLPADQLAAAFHAAGQADACLVIGTSGAVYPAAGIVHAAREAGASVIVVDPGDTEYDALADIRLVGPAGELVPPLLQAARAG